MDMQNIKMILTGLNAAQQQKWKELNQGDIQGRHGGMVSTRIRKYLV